MHPKVNVLQREQIHNNINDITVYADTQVTASQCYVLMTCSGGSMGGPGGAVAPPLHCALHLQIDGKH